jgi:hypothetical protein
MKKVMITSATVFALVVNTGMSVAHPSGGYDQQTEKLPDTCFQMTSEFSNSDPCDSCTDAWS